MRAEFVAQITWIGVGVAIAWMARALGLGTLAEPGPGMLACGLGVLMALVAGTGAVRNLIRLGALTSSVSAGAMARVAGLCIGLSLYIAALVPVGFPIATFAFLLALFVVYADLRWPKALAISAAVTIATYALFRYGLGTQLPAGWLG